MFSKISQVIRHLSSVKWSRASPVTSLKCPPSPTDRKEKGWLWLKKRCGVMPIVYLFLTSLFIIKYLLQIGDKVSWSLIVLFRVIVTKLWRNNLAVSTWQSKMPADTIGNSISSFLNKTDQVSQKYRNVQLESDAADRFGRSTSVARATSVARQFEPASSTFMRAGSVARGFEVWNLASLYQCLVLKMITFRHRPETPSTVRSASRPAWRDNPRHCSVLTPLFWRQSTSPTFCRLLNPITASEKIKTEMLNFALWR